MHEEKEVTTKPQSKSREESICRFCDQAIHLAGDEWKHNFNDSIWCRPTTATPRSPASTAPVVEKEWAKLLAKAISTAEPTLMPERDNLTHYVISSEAFATLAQVHRAIAKRLWGTTASAAPVESEEE